MRILLTGTEGYIGCRMAPYLVNRGHDVTGFDAGYYRDGWLYSDPAELAAARTVIKDLRRLDASDFDGYDAVVHLAELSNDPLGENNPEVTYDINHRGSVRIAQLAKAAGVRRFVYASSCSVYGAGTGDFLDETSAVNPQTAYARCKVLVERDLVGMAEAGFCVTFLRNATAYGPSPRMRFDLVINDLCARAWTTQAIVMTSDGTPWRPVVHVEDICQAFWRVLEAPVERVNGQVYNVGATRENYRVRELADIIGSEFPGCTVTVGPPSADNRSYRVNFDKIAQHLGYEATWTARTGAAELRRLFERIEFDTAAHSFRAFTRLKQLKYLSRTGQIDEHFYWRTPGGSG